MERIDAPEATEQVRQIKALVDGGKLDAAHSKKDELYVNALFSIANASNHSDKQELRVLALRAMEAELIEFPRHTAWGHAAMHAYDDDGWHSCHFCGTMVKDGKESDGTRHHLSDCRPDLTAHEIGETCTWAYRRDQKPFKENETCYAYQDSNRNWTNEHTHFYPDGPM